MTADARLAAIAAAQPYPLVFAALSGAHLYGIASADSDFDLRGVHVLSVPEVVGIDSGPETLEVSGREHGFDLDFQTHDLRKFCILLLRRNGFVLEQLYSPLVVTTGSAHEELKEIARGCVTRQHVHHYLGAADTQRRLFEGGAGGLKALLYVFRGLKTGIHLMRTGEVEANLERLAQEEPVIAYLGDLMAAKRAGAERARIPEGQRDRYEDDVERLRIQLEAEGGRSRLPAEPSAHAALHDFVVRTRLKPPAGC